MTLRVGLLGCGRIAAFFHAPILARVPGARLVAIADPDAANRARVAAAAPGATHYADWHAPIAMGEVDAVVICLPPALHAPAAIAALEAGCHAYVEKPLALTAAEGRAMILARDRAGRTAQVGLNFRFHPLIEDARARISGGALGEVLAIRTLFASARRALPGWKGQPGAGGDALADLGTHHIDLAAHLLGAPVLLDSVRSEETRRPEGSLAVVTARMGTGALLSITASQLTGAGGQWIEVLGEAGHLLIDLADARPRPLLRPAGRLARAARLGERLGALSPAEIAHRPERDPSFARALHAFVAAASEGRAAHPSLDDGLAALEVVEAASRAAPWETSA